MVAHAGDQVAGPLVLLAEGVHNAAAGPECGEVIAGEVLIGTLVAVAGEGAVNHLGELLVELIIGEAGLCQSLGTPVGEEDIGVLKELEEDLLTGLALEVQNDAALVGVFQIEGGVLIGAAAATLADAVPANCVAALGLDLDNVGAVVSKESCAGRNCDEGTELNNFESGKCLVHIFSSKNLFLSFENVKKIRTYSYYNYNNLFCFVNAVVWIL